MIKVGSIELGFKQNNDGTCREMTHEERASFRPTHCVGYGFENGVAVTYTTDLVTGKCVTQPLLQVTQKEFEDAWFNVQSSKE